VIRDPEALAERARELVDCNGMRLVRVVLVPAGAPVQAHLYVEFFNPHGLAALQATPAADAPFVFPIAGGLRLAGGPLPGQVRVTSVAPDPEGNPLVLLLTVEPIGDYTTYTLMVDPPAGVCIDPVFSELRFRFRPGCFENCPPEWERPRALRPGPAIDYLARDYESFRHQAIARMMDRVPDWQPTSEADLDMVLLELFAVAADELADFQDRVMNEAYLATARKRVSLARHARLVDYHVHEGSQGSTWLAVEALGPGPVALAAPFTCRTHQDAADPDAVFFVAFPADPDERPAYAFHPALNRAPLYTWSDGIPALAEGSTTADLAMPSATDADEVEALIRTGVVTHLLIEERLNPLTGLGGGRDPQKRQLLQLLPGNDGARSLRDPVEGNAPFVRVRWRDEDRLRARYCFVVDCGGTRVDGVACFRGNLVPARHGRLETAVFHQPGDALPAFPIPGQVDLHYTLGLRGEALCALPSPFVAYRFTEPGGEVPPRSTVQVVIDADPWDEVPWLVFSTDAAETGDHFVAETDEEGWTVLRFGDGVNGRRVPGGEAVRATYQVGRGLDGNVGADSLTFFDTAAFPAFVSVRNPLDVTTGTAPEPPEEIVRRAPEAFRHRQLRAVTLADYVNRAQEVAGVARAAAAYQWTGSWRAVRVTVDPAGALELDDDLAAAVFRHLDAVRLIGDDLEVRGPFFVPLQVTVRVCIDPAYWPRDVRFLLEAEFSTGYAPDGSPAFFHPDRWTFGQPLRAAEIMARAQKVEGVHHVVSVELRRLYDALPAGETVQVGPSEIVLVENDPDHHERGAIRFDLQGGRT
jgi:hypothetical protein